MGSLYSRFTFNSQGSRFHSSGIAANQNGIGTASSAKTYATRKKIDVNRQRINPYDTAALNHDYRRNALPEMQEDQQKNREKYKQRVDDLLGDSLSNRESYIKKQREDKKRLDLLKAKAGGSSAPSSQSMAADVVVSERQKFNAHTEQNRPIVVPPREMTRFREPPSRGYDPYR